MRGTLTAAVCAAALSLGACGVDEPTAGPGSTAPSSSTAASLSPHAPDPAPTSAPTSAPPSSPPGPPKPRRPPQRDVLAVSVDGLAARVLEDRGAAALPTFGRLLGEGAATLDARTAVETTVTLPNHAGMLTGRRVEAVRGGHGVTWNEELPGRIVPGPDGDGVASVFDVVKQAAGTTALFAGKDKFATFQRSWGSALNRFEVDADADRLVEDALADLVTERRRFTFVHLALPDQAGHDAGWSSPAYLAAVEKVDRLLGEVLDTIAGSPRLSRRLVVVLTADHGGPMRGTVHDDADDPENFTVPFVVWGRGIPAGDLYALNPDYADPGDAQPGYDGAQPVRNADLANLATDLLDLGPVPGSEMGVGQDLDWR